MDERERGFSPHEVEWTHELSARFWDYYSSGEARGELYFSHQFGNALLDHVIRKTGPLGRVLDFGCGQGFLMERMLDRGIGCSGLDFSGESVDLVRHRLGEREGLEAVVKVNGLPGPFEASSFDTVFLIETVEHLLPEDLDATLAEVHRLLAAGGRLVVTVPNDENLDARKVVCPECGAVFHRKQHVSSWHAESLASMLVSRDFAIGQDTEVTPVFLRPRSALNPLREYLSRRRGDKPPHLIAIVRDGS